MPRRKKNSKVAASGDEKLKAAMEEATKDERFSKVLQNPLYRRVPKKEKSVTIDKRFQSMFHDKSFKLKYHMDTRGRPLQTTSNENLKRLYNLEESEEEEDGSEGQDNDKEDEVGQEDKEDEEEASSSGSDTDQVENHFDKPDMESKPGLTKQERKKLHSQDIDYTRGEGHFFSGESSDDSDSTVDDELEEDVMHEWGEMDRDAPRTEEATSRLALCNMDWDRLSASDLMLLFSSFVPTSGVLKKVTIYPSEFGKQRLAEEEIHGPKELVEGKQVKREEDDEAEDEDEDEEGKNFHMEKLRKYQLKRLKYYYAVLEFDSERSADAVYTECDGMEYESSATRIDLRFIPEDMTFDEEPKESCDKVPEADKYRPRFFTTKALQQFKVDLTWDETDPRRKDFTNRIFNPKEKVDDEDIQAYLASSDSDSDIEKDDRKGTDDVEDDKKNDPILKYKALLQSIEDNEKKKKERDVEMEISWGVGLKQKSEQLVKKKLEEKASEKMTPWEEMLAKRREKRKTRKAEKKSTENESSGDDLSDEETDDDDKVESASDEKSDVDQPFSDDDVDIDMNDQFFREELKNSGITSSKSKKGKGKAKELEAKDSSKTVKKQAELELLLMDEQDDSNKHHFSLKKIMDAEKAESSKKKKKKMLKKKKNNNNNEEDKGKVQDDFAINLEDDRFNALFTSHKFNVDPSDPNFKKTKAMDALIQERQKRRVEETKREEKPAQSETAEDNPLQEVSAAKKSKSDLAFLVKSIKGKAESLKNKKKNIKSKS